MLAINNLYFTWLMNKVSNQEIHSNEYAITENDILKCEQLFVSNYYPSNDLDYSRSVDGITLRRTFLFEAGNSEENVSCINGMCPMCNILEMMVALAIKMDLEVLFNPYYGFRHDIWFWNMYATLGLYTDDDVKGIVSRFNEKRYCENGIGGLFTIPNTDVRSLDIWTQMSWWVSYNQL